MPRSSPLFFVLLLACQPPDDEPLPLPSGEEGFDHTLGTELDDRTMGGPGIAVGDVDGDGHADLYLTSNVGPGFDHADGLYFGDGAGGFEPASANWGVGQGIGRSWGAVLADLDNDGDADLLVANSGPHDLYLQEGGRFQRRSMDAGFRTWPQEIYAAGLTLGDYDADGILDLFIINHQFQGGDQQNGPFPADELYRGVGDGTFVDMSHLLPEDRTDNGGFAASWTDVDDDADLDLYLVSDSLAPYKNQLFRNDGPGTGPGDEHRFTPVSEGCGCDLTIDGMGVALLDYDGDERLDFYMSNTDGEVLLRAEGDLVWTDTTAAAGARAGGGDRSVSWGVEALDWDLDTWPDLAVAFGGKETFEEVRNSLLRNDGGVFTREDTLGLYHEGDSHGLAPLDANEDGCPDLVVANLRQPPELQLNRCPYEGRHWLGLRLQGTDSPRDAAGARVLVRTPDGRAQVQDVLLGSSSVHGSRGPDLHFGLGGNTVIDEVVVRWTSGREERFDAAPDAVQTLVEGAGR